MARAKKETSKATTEKETAVKAESTAEVKAVKETAKSEVKTEAKSAKAAKTETSSEVKKTPAKAAKETIKCTIQYQSKDTTIEEIVNSIKENYKAEGNKTAIKTLNVYIQPENGIAYYVVNGTEEGKINY